MKNLFAICLSLLVFSSASTLEAKTYAYDVSISGNVYKSGGICASNVVIDGNAYLYDIDIYASNYLDIKEGVSGNANNIFISTRWLSIPGTFLLQPSKLIQFWSKEVQEAPSDKLKVQFFFLEKPFLCKGFMPEKPFITLTGSGEKGPIAIEIKADHEGMTYAAKFDLMQAKMSFDDEEGFIDECQKRALVDDFDIRLIDHSSGNYVVEFKSNNDHSIQRFYLINGYLYNLSVTYKKPTSWFNSVYNWWYVIEENPNFDPFVEYPEYIYFFETFITSNR